MLVTINPNQRNLLSNHLMSAIAASHSLDHAHPKDKAQLHLTRDQMHTTPLYHLATNTSYYPNTNQGTQNVTQET